MAQIEFKRGPLKGRSYGLVAEDGMLGIASGRGDLDKDKNVRRWVTLDLGENAVGIGFGKGEDSQDDDIFPDLLSFRLHRSGIGLVKEKLGGDTTYSFEAFDYVSPKKLLFGKIRQVDEDFAELFPSVLEQGTKSFDLYLATGTSSTKSITFPPRSPGRGTLGQVLSEYMRFLQDLQFDPMFQDVGMVTAITYPRMARFVVNQLGFHSPWNESFQPNKSDPLSQRRMKEVFGMKDELIAQRSRIYQLSQLAKSI